MFGNKDYKIIWKRLTNGIELFPESEPIIFFTTQTMGMLSTKVENVLPMVYNNVFGIYIPFYLKIINNIIILPPIIRKVVASKFFIESIRFETLELISVVGLGSNVWDVVWVVVSGLSMPGRAVWVDGICAYW